MNRAMKAAAAAVCGMALVWGNVPSQGADLPSEEALIRSAVANYVAAFNRGDAKALAAFWSPDAVYTNPVSGEQATGREEIEKQFSGIFSDSQGLTLEAQTLSIEFVSPSVAVEQGIAKVKRAGEEADGDGDAEEPAEASEYSAVYIKRDGQWLLDRVTEEDIPVVETHYDQLKELEWMIGDWVDQDDQSRIMTSCHWTKNRNFITRYFVLEVRDRIEMAGMQIVGWDPATKQIRSWVFDSDGGFGEGVWQKKGTSWYIHATGTLSDGGKSSSVNIIKQVNDDTFTWQSINRQAEGELLPNVDEVVVVRQTAAE